METLVFVGGWIWWFLGNVLYILFWTWPIYYVSWLAVIVLAISARSEYVKSGRGLRGLAYALWFSLINLPRTMNAIVRWIVMQILLLAGLTTKTDILSQLPNFVRRWLGHSPIETRTVYRDRIVEQVRWKRQPFRRRFTKLMLAMLAGHVFTRAYDHWDTVGPWIFQWF